jgi:hypothetical protein
MLTGPRHTMWVVRLDLWISERTADFLQRPEGVLKFSEWLRASIEREITLIGSPAAIH